MTEVVSNDDVVIAANEPEVYDGRAPADSGGDIVFRTGGIERARIKADGSGSGWPTVLGGSIPVFAPAPSGDVTGATDTPALQAAITSALTKGAKLVTSSYSTLGVATPYYVNAQLNFTPPASSPDGFAVLDWEHHGYTKSSFIWVGANNGVMFHAEGLKRSYVNGVRSTVTDATTGVVVWDIDVTVANPSTSFLTFENCPVNLGTGASNIGWRMGHSNGGIADMSFLNWDNCSVVGNNGGGTAVATQIGWVNETANGLVFNWFGGAGLYLGKMFSNVSTAGAGSAQGNCSMNFYGFGGSHNTLDFEFAAPGSYLISGGRYENGTTFLSTTNASNNASVVMDAVIISTYAVGAVFSISRPGTISLDGCYIYGTDHTAALFTLGGFTGHGQLIVRGGGIRSADPFFTVSGATWDVTVEAVGILNSSSQTINTFTSRFPYNLDDGFRGGFGILSWNYNPFNATANSAPTSQTIYAMPVYLRAGQVVSKLGFVVQTAGVGTTPTNIFAGLCDSTGKMVAQTADVAANAAWTSVGLKSVSLSSSFAVTTSGLYYIVLLENGTWGTTAMQLARTSAFGTQIDGAGAFLYATGGTAQTALPANGSSITLSGASGPLNFAVFAK